MDFKNINNENGLKINGFDVAIMENLRKEYPEHFTESGSMDYNWFEEYIRPNFYIYIRGDRNSISFTLESEDNDGCTLETLVHSVIDILLAQNKKCPIREKSLAITKFEEGILWLHKYNMNKEIKAGKEKL